MPTPTIYPSAKQVVGLAVETTMGTANTTLAATAPVTEFKAVDKPTWLVDKGMRGSMVEEYGLIQGPVVVEWTMKGAVFFDWLPYLLRNLFGDLTTTGPVSSQYTHAISILNSGTGQPSSLTIVDWQGLTATTQARMYTGCCVEELTLKGNPESTLIEFEAKGKGFRSQAYPTSPPTFSPSTDQPMAAWRVVMGLGGPASGGTLVSTVRDWEVTYTRQLKPEYVSNNSQYPVVIARGSMTGTGKLNFSVPSDETALNYLLNNTQPQWQLVVDNGLATSAKRSLQIDQQLTAFDSVEVARSEEAVGYESTFKAIANTTNAGASGGYSIAKLTTINATASGY